MNFPRHLIRHALLAATLGLNGVRLHAAPPQYTVVDLGTLGEVTSAPLSTAQNPAAVAPLSQAADGSYNQSPMQQVIDKLDELLSATKRT